MVSKKYLKFFGIFTFLLVLSGLITSIIIAISTVGDLGKLVSLSAIFLLDKPASWFFIYYMANNIMNSPYILSLILTLATGTGFSLIAAILINRSD